MSLFRSPLVRRWLVAVTAFVLVLVLALAFFPWDDLRQPLNRYVSNQLGRRFEITRHLAVHLGRTTTVRAEAVEIANPPWAHEPYLLRAKVAEIDVRLWPLLLGRIELPRVSLSGPQIGLQIEPDGRRTWTLARDRAKAGAAPSVGVLLVDQGQLDYRASGQGAHLQVAFSLVGEGAAPLPLSYRASGTWKNVPVTAAGHAGGVLKLSRDTQAPFPLEVDAAAGSTRLQAKGSIAGLADLSGIEASFDLSGHNLDELYRLLGVVLPSTPPYRVRARLDKQEKVWAISQIQGVLGNSDLSGALTLDQSGPVPLLSGKAESKLLDFADLGPVIGLAPPARVSASPPREGLAVQASAHSSASAAASRQSRPVRARPAGKVLPTTPLDVSKLKSMNADVLYSATDIRHARALPIERGSVHVRLKAGQLVLEPIALGVAGGTVAGRIAVDANLAPADFSTRLDVRGLQLNRLFPTVQSTRSALGRISGNVDLNGRGNSLAQMLGSASGNIAVLMGKGEISNILLEFMGLDGGEIIKFLVGGDRNVPLRCAAAAFDVRRGVMSSRVIVLDTTDTVVTGQGQVNLADETLDILFKPVPKDASILSLRSPLRIAGTLGAPSTGPQTGALAARAGLALALGAINPLLALAATVETGPGENVNCTSVLRQAASPKTAGQPAASNK